MEERLASPYEVLSGEAKWCVITADCIDVLPNIRHIDATITDPPYGVDMGNATSASGRGGGHGLSKANRGYDWFADTYDNFVANVVPRINAAIDISDRAAVFTGPHIHEQRKPDAIGGVFCPAAVARHAWGFKSLCPVLLYGKKPNGNGGSYPTVISSTAVAEKIGHPVPKPLEWMLWVVGLATLPGQCILDPFCGSGTTGVAAIRQGRRFIGIELHPPYADEARERLAAEDRCSSIKASRVGQISLFKAGER